MLRRETYYVIGAGSLLGLLAVLMVKAGNPSNMGICIACFLRDITGSLGLHQAAPAQYMRPEIPGMVLGAFLTALTAREFRPQGGSSTAIRFALGFLGMFGMLVFLGCPVRTLLRLAAGDLNALVGLLGLIAGVAIGAWVLQSGFTLGRSVPQPYINGYVFPAIALVLIIILFAGSSFLAISVEGPASFHAPALVSIAAGVLIGVAAQRSRLCMIGGIRDFFLFRDIHLLSGAVAVLVVTFIGSLATGAFNPGFEKQPIAHSNNLWNFLGMVLAGWAFVLLGGCPLRQLIAAGEGNSDCVITIIGLTVGAAVAHNFGLAASPKGVPPAGQAAVVIGLLVVLLVSLIGRKTSSARG